MRRMARINYSRVVIGGLAAGVVANLCDLVWSFVLAGEMDRMIQRLNLNRGVVNSGSTATTWILVDFVYATLIVWTYAAIRPRFGPGPSTAIRAAIVICGAVTVILFGFHRLGFFTTTGFFLSAALSFVSAILAGLVGARLYREP
jgi:hypothetical protein